MMNEIDSIKQAISAIEQQRSVLGDAVVDTALAPLRERLAILQPRPDVEQRKLVTVLFADLVGFTAISEQMDPEDMREIVNAYFTRWTICIERFGGVVEKFIGDAVMAVFGLSVSREDEPENAVRAAIEMRQELAELNKNIEREWGQQLAMRVGIHTGTVVVSFFGERKGQDFVVVGDTVNLASRLQSIAPSGTIIISHDTYRHVRGSFEMNMLNPVNVKGKEEPVQAYQVIRAKRRFFRDPTRGVEGIETRLIGRDLELDQLKKGLIEVSRYQKAQVMTVVGEAGIGKSRLIAEFMNWLELLPQTVHSFKCRAGPSAQNLPYFLLRDLLSSTFRIYDSDPPQSVQEKIERGIGEFEYAESGSVLGAMSRRFAGGELQPEIIMRAHFIGRLLGFSIDNSPYLSDVQLDPKLFRDRTVSYLIDYFKARLSSGSVVMLLEDIHWADETSLEILVRIWKALGDEGLFVVASTRPIFFEYHLNWDKQTTDDRITYTSIPLEALSQQDSQNLVDEIFNAKEVPEFLRSLIVNRSEGNPFFIEELIKMYIEERVILKTDGRWQVDQSRLEGIRTPSTLVGVLQARVDSLKPDERMLLQRASVIGRTFWEDALIFMDEGQADTIRIGPNTAEILTKLRNKEMVFTQPVSTFKGMREYYFIHTLLRDVTYENLLKRLRKIYHAYAAEWLAITTEQVQRSDQFASLIAEHYERADDREKARDWYERAANQAIATFANAEGIRCLTHFLELKPREDITGKYALLLKRVKLYDLIADRQAQKIDLETLQSLADTLDQQQSIDDSHKLSRRAQVSLQWWLFYDAIGDIPASTVAVQDAIDFAYAQGDVENEASGNLSMGVTLWRQSKNLAAQDYIRKALVLARAAESASLEADCLRNLAIIFQLMGNFLEARTNYEKALQIYNQTGSLQGESMTLNSLGSLLTEQCLFREALPYFERSLELKRKIGHRRAEHNTLYNLGTLFEKLGNFLDAIEYMEMVHRFAVETSDPSAEADALNALGSIALHMGDFGKANTCLERAFNLARETNEKITECETLGFLAFLSIYTNRNQDAHQYSQDLIALAKELDQPLYQAKGLKYAGTNAFNLGRINEASQHFKDALDLARKRSYPPLIIESQAGLALSYLAQNELIQASGIVEGILDLLVIGPQIAPEAQLRIDFSKLEGVEEPFQVLLACFKILHAQKDPRAYPFLLASYRLLIEQSERLPAGTVRENYLQMIPPHRALQELYDQFAARTKAGSP